MDHIKLNDLLNLDTSGKDYKSGKIYFNHGWDEGKRHVSALDAYLTKDKECEFSLGAYGDKGVKRFHENSLLIVAIQMDRNDRWLLTKIYRIGKIFKNSPAEHQEIEEYKKWEGRVIFHFKKGQQGQLYIKTVFESDDCYVEEVLTSPYSGEPFPGYYNFCKPMREIDTYINNTGLGDDWKKSLKVINAVYCLYNRDENKAYIGCAYGDKGLLGRWQNYFDNFHGGDVELKKLYKEKGDDYFLDNFYFSILEILPSSVSADEVVDREHHWMDVFNSRLPDGNGYNRN